MELTNEFEVEVPVDEAWAVLTDLERITPCLPGARPHSRSTARSCRGIRRRQSRTRSTRSTRAGPFVEPTRHQPSGRAVGQGQRHPRPGQRDAPITVASRAARRPAHRSTVITDLTVSGKVAQFGRGVLADVGGGDGRLRQSGSSTTTPAPATQRRPTGADGDRGAAARIGRRPRRRPPPGGRRAGSALPSPDGVERRPSAEAGPRVEASPAGPRQAPAPGGWVR